MKQPVVVEGLGAISRQQACEIEVCDEMGCFDQFNAIAASQHIRPHGYTDKEVRMALYKMEKDGRLKKVAPAKYEWTPKGCGQETSHQKPVETS